ncbi:MAG TPA: hypothetical protein VH723_06450 [Candidatus Limnocylindrales bacterium]|jgi:hypothetical protein
MFPRNRPEPTADDAAAFREHVRRLESPERRRTEAAHVRILLTRTWPIGLRERLARASEAPTRA